MNKILVTGAGGFIGGHLAQHLINDGYKVKSVDIKPLNEWFQVSDKSENFTKPVNMSDFFLNETQAQLQLAMFGFSDEFQEKTNKIIEDITGN